MTSTTVLGALFLAGAAANIYWAVKVWSLSRASGTPEDIVTNRARAKKLNLWSRITTGVACAIALVFLFVK
jgi:hypothetical protein